MEARLAIEIVLSVSPEDTFKLLTNFNQQKFERSLLERLRNPESRQLHGACLQAIRILSRDKQSLNVLSTEEALSVLIKHSGLQDVAGNTNGETIQEGDFSVVVEAQKCLSNIVYNSLQAAMTCCERGCIEGIVRRMMTYKDPQLCYDIKYYDMRLLFLFTALVEPTRYKIKSELHGFTYLMETLDLIISDKTELTDSDVDLTCEILKILFNITMAVDKNNVDEEEEAHSQRLVSILHDLLLISTASKDKTEELNQHTVNLLTNMPRASYGELLTADTDSSDMSDDVAMCSDYYVEYDGKNMATIVVLLNFLEKRLSEPKKSFKEKLSPVLHCLCELCRENRTMRKFCRLKVLPPLRSDVKRLPEEGTSLRNKLVKQFTGVVTEIKELAADFCFILCKENVGRFIKYTGYGNAAGLLAQRGLMCGGRTSEYSSESEDSETEEYAQLAAGVNPVTGRWEAPKHNPNAGMSEEQKEYEAMQLVQQFDRLTREGVVQPMVVGADGRPQVVQHVQQLVQQGVPHVARDSDDD